MHHGSLLDGKGQIIRVITSPLTPHSITVL